MNFLGSRWLWPSIGLPLLVLLACGAWWLTTEGCRLSLPAHQGAVRSVALSDDGSLLASGGADGQVRLWDLPAGRARSSFSLPRGITALAHSPSGDLLAASSNGLIRVWDVAGERERVSIKAHKDGAAALSFSPDGKALYSAGSDRVIRALDTTTGKEVAQLAGHNGKVYALAVAPDGTLASGGAGDSVIRLWRLPSRTPVMLRGHTNRVTALTFAKDGKVLLSADRDGQMKQWDVTSGREAESPGGMPGRVIGMTSSQDSITAASEEQGLLRWSLADVAKSPRRWRSNAVVNALAVSADGRTAVTAGSDGRVRVWQLP